MNSCVVIASCYISGCHTMFHVIAKRVPLQGIASVCCRTYSAQQASSSSSGQPTINVNVSGLSDNVVRVPNAPVGPNAAKNKEYKNPEYFCYHIDSFGEAEVELAKYRLPVPSNKKPFQN